MRKPVGSLIWILATLACAALAACDGSSGGTQPTPAELALATGALDQQLNASGEAMRRVLASADADKRIFPWELAISGEARPTPVDWWLYDRGFIRVGGVQGLQGYFVLTPKGEALLKAGSPRWLVSSFQGPPQVTCAGSPMFASCRVLATASVAAAAQAKDLVADGPAVSPRNFEVVLQKNADGWSAGEFSDRGSPPPAEAGRLALFGDATAVAKARYRYALEVNRQVH